MPEPGIHGSLRISAAGLSAQRIKMNVVSQNIANAETTRTEKGGPYRRKLVQFSGTDFAVRLAEQSRPGRNLLGVTHHNHIPVSVLPERVSDPSSDVAVEARIIESESLGPLVHDPTHPDANADGYVRFPAVNIVTEMTDLMAASRAYQANATAIDAAKQMALRALDI